MTRPLVYVTRRVPQEALNIISKSCEYRIWDHENLPVPRNILRDELKVVRGALVLLTEQINRELLEEAKNLTIVANMAVGYDNIDVTACTERKIMITNTPGVLTETTADLTWALLMATARRIVEGQKVIERNEWHTWSPMMLAGQDVHGTTLGIIGAGRIGEAVARRAKGFNMHILYHNRNRRPDLEEATGAEYVSLDDLLKSSDFIITLVPLTSDTRHLINKDTLQQMKHTAILINASRGPVVDEQALLTALKKGRIWGAGLDVWEDEPISSAHPLLQLPNVVALPHIGSASISTRIRMATMAAENLVAGVTGSYPANWVNQKWTLAS